MGLRELDPSNKQNLVQILEEGIHWVCTTCEKEKKYGIQVAIYNIYIIYNAVLVGKKAEMELGKEERENVEIKATYRLRELLRQKGEEKEKT